MDETDFFVPLGAIKNPIYTMIYSFRVTLPGIKGFFRVYHLRSDNSLYSFHKQMRADMEFPQDQLILFKAFAGDGSTVIARYGLFDLGNGEAKTCDGPRRLTTPKHYAYIKISEGCDRNCAYCAIPIITGKHVSRPMDEILDEVRQLAENGTREFQIIAQELTYYGIDIDGKQHIAELVSKMADIKGVKWIRLHYAYPAHFPWDLLKVMREKPNVCKYLDIALQHISDNMLQRMHRHVTKEETYSLIERIRKEVPGIHLRTTLMVGFPGETEEDFEELMEFTRKVRFERMGAFAYSEEEGTFSAENYEDNVPEEIKPVRLDKLMALQQRISAELEAEKVGKTMKVVIDRKEGNYYVGRTEYCSPEVDPEVLIPVEGRRLRVGQMVDAIITDSEEFDLYAKVE